MTVTYRRVAMETVGRGGGAGGGWDRAGGGGRGRGEWPNPEPVRCLCHACDTHFEVRVVRQEGVVFGVRGRTCQSCNPHRRPPPDPPRGGRLVTVVPTHPSGGSPCIETLSEDVVDKSALYFP